MDRIFNITGTPDELEIVMYKEFYEGTTSCNTITGDDIRKKQARFFVSLLLPSEDSECETNNNMDLAMWQVSENQIQRFQTPLFNSRYNISFTELGKQVSDMLFDIFVSVYVLGSGTEVISLIYNCIKAIFKSSAHVKSEECCVYYQALEWRITNPSQEMFSVEDILPEGNEGYCRHLDRLSTGWKCFFCNQEQCEDSDRRNQFFADVLKELANRNVLTQYNGTLYKFKL